MRAPPPEISEIVVASAAWRRPDPTPGFADVKRPPLVDPLTRAGPLGRVGQAHWAGPRGEKRKSGLQGWWSRMSRLIVISIVLAALLTVAAVAGARGRAGGERERAQ